MDTCVSLSHNQQAFSVKVNQAGPYGPFPRQIPAPMSSACLLFTESYVLPAPPTAKSQKLAQEFMMESM